MLYATNSELIGEVSTKHNSQCGSTKYKILFLVFF